MTYLTNPFPKLQGEETTTPRLADRVYSKFKAEIDVKVGYFIARGSASDIVKNPNNVNDEILGFIPHISAYEDKTIKAGMQVPHVLIHMIAYLHCQPTANVSRGDQVYIDISNADLTKIGFLTNVATNNLLVKGIFFDNDSLANEPNTFTYNSAK